MTAHSSTSPRYPGSVAAGQPARRTICRVLGHGVDSSAFARDRAAPFACPCGAEILGEDGSETHVGHVLSCFLLGHVYVTAGERDRHIESVCERCGHPLVVGTASPYARRARFWKPVRYLCGILGHRVHEVGERNGFVEYACHCGHSFLSKGRVRGRIHHPAACVLDGHYVRFVERRFEYAEFRCRRCGHPFCFPARG